MTIKGTVICEVDLYLDGEIEGTVEAIESTVTVGPTARLAANINARRVIVMGSVQGDVVALDTVELRKNSTLAGHVIASRIIIEDGATLKGSTEIRRRTTPAPSLTEVAGLEERLSSLSNLKESRGLDRAEELELELLSSKLKSLDVSLYEPLLRKKRRAATAG